MIARIDHRLLTTLLLCIGIFSLAPSSYAELPDIGEPADLAMSPQEEQKLGSSFYRALQQQESILNDPELSSYLQSLGNRLNSGIGQKPFHFFIVKDGGINAFAVPGGFIGINAGLILATRNEGELAGVMAHEIAHVTQRHIARFYSSSGGTASWAQIGAVLAAIALASQGQGDGAAAALYAGTAAGYQSLINHTRAHEQEADRIGIQYLAQAGFNPGDMAGFFDVMRDKSLESDNRFEILRTHPLSANRVAEAKARAAQIGTKAIPSSKRYHLMKARLVTLLGQQRELLKHYQKNTQTLAQADLYAYALLLKQNNQIDKAHKILQQAIQQDPDNIHYQLAKAQLYIAEDKYTAAKSLLATLLQLYPGHMPSSVFYAQSLKHLEQFEQSIQFIKNFEQQYSMPTQLYFLLAESYSQTQQTALSLYNQGRYYFYTGNYRAAGLQLNAAEKKGKLSEKEMRVVEQLQKVIEEEKKRK